MYFIPQLHLCLHCSCSVLHI